MEKLYLEGLSAKTRLMVYKDDMVLGPGVVRLLELVRETQSLSEACRVMEMAYSKAWKLIKKSEESIGVKLLQGIRGGKNGGQTILTPEGEELLNKYCQMQKEMNEAVDEIFNRIFMEKTV